MLISEVARVSGLNKTTIRYYHSRGLLRATPVAAGSREYFDFDDRSVHVAKFIKKAQSAGFTLRETGKILDGWYDGTHTKSDKIKILEGKLKQLMQKRDNILAMEEEIYIHLKELKRDA